MSCFHGYEPVEGNESAFSIDASAITFGPGVLGEAGLLLAGHGCKRVALFTDARVVTLPPLDAALRSVRAAGLDVVVYNRVHVEPTDASFRQAADFARDGRFDGYLSVGGGSVMDTCKAAQLYATYPAELRTYVNAPVGDGKPVPGPLPPHVACPTTCGTGSECTGIAVFDNLTLKAKTGIASRRLRPTHALVDPTATHSLPAMVVAASGFDVLCHALESYTARPYTGRQSPASPGARPMSQGRNPWSDVGALEALRVGGRCLTRAVADPTDHAAREALAWAATLAGIAFGNAGVHLPHAMSYSVAGLVRDYRCPGYPAGEALVPHGVSVVVNAPSVFRATAATSPERHLAAAAALGANPIEVRDTSPDEVGELLALRLVQKMRATGVPLGVSRLGYGDGDLEALARGAFIQKRLVDNAPMPVTEETMRALFRGAMAYA